MGDKEDARKALVVVQAQYQGENKISQLEIV
jgi:hypothetical protein